MLRRVPLDAGALGLGHRRQRLVADLRRRLPRPRLAVHVPKRDRAVSMILVFE